MSHEPKHPFTVFSSTWIQDWKTWLEWWSKPDLPFEFRHSLLHFAFKVPVDNDKDRTARLQLLLDLAEGHRDSYSGRFHVATDLDPYHGYNTVFGQINSESGGRKFLTEKAYQVLCLEFFRNSANPERYDQPSWLGAVTNPETLLPILHFFRVEPGHGSFGFVNILHTDADRAQKRGDNHDAHALRFVHDLCGLIWNPKKNWVEGNIRQTDKVIKLFGEVKELTIPILAAQKRLRILLEVDCQIPLGSYSALKKVVMSESIDTRTLGGFQSSTSRLPMTFEEAFIAGSTAAHVVLVLRKRAHLKYQVLRRERLRTAKREIEQQLASA